MTINRECFENYKPYLWDHNGPFAVFRAAKRICKKDKIVDMTPELCWGFKLMHPSLFFPLPGYYEILKEALDREPTEVKKQLNRITNETIAVHFWSSISNKVPILKSQGKIFYTIYAQKFCPKAYEASGPYFK